MTGMVMQQRCWNHDSREAVCRCLGCGRSYCRECVTEHESRLLCAACLRNLAQAAARKRGRLRRVVAAGLTLTGVVLAWIVFFAVGESILTLRERSERMEWRNR